MRHTLMWSILSFFIKNNTSNIQYCDMLFFIYCFTHVLFYIQFNSAQFPHSSCCALTQNETMRPQKEPRWHSPFTQAIIKRQETLDKKAGQQLRLNIAVCNSGIATDSPCLWRFATLRALTHTTWSEWWLALMSHVTLNWSGVNDDGGTPPLIIPLHHR